MTVLKLIGKLGIAAHTYNLRLWAQGHQHKFKASLVHLMTFSWANQRAK